jgi:hypothetical protein
MSITFQPIRPFSVTPGKPVQARFGGTYDPLPTLQRMRGAMEQLEPGLERAIRSGKLVDALSRIGKLSDAEEMLLLHIAAKMDEKDKAGGKSPAISFTSKVKGAIVTSGFPDEFFQDLADEDDRKRWGKPGEEFGS